MSTGKSKKFNADEIAATEISSRGLRFEKQGRWDEAMEAHIAACRLAPHIADFWERVGSLYINAAGPRTHPGFGVPEWHIYYDFGRAIVDRIDGTPKRLKHLGKSGPWAPVATFNDE